MTAAIAYVDWAGNPAELEAIQELGNRYKIPVIQDAAHAYGAKWRGQSIADFADFTCFSFQAIKHLSSGDGGALVCRDDSSYNLAKKLKWFGYDRDATKDEKGNWKGQRWEADILEGEVGYKFNMNNLAAAVGLAGMDSIDTVLDQHRANANILIELLGNSELFEVIPLPKHAQSSYWVFTILTNLSKEKRDELLLRLNSAGVEAGLVHLPNDTYSAFRTSKMSLPGVRSFSERQISLPCGWWLTNDDCRKIGEITLRIASDLA
jgi:dTDP-4-amino-4,6-dideoxygalactose transaminase